MTNSTRIGGLPDSPSTLRLSEPIIAKLANSYTSGYVDVAFLGAAAAEGLHSVRKASWRTQFSKEAWKLDAEILASGRFDGGEEIMFRVSSGVAQLVVREKSVVVNSAGASPAAALETENWFRQRLPEHIEENTFDGSVLTRVVWAGNDGRSDEFARNIEAQRFAEMELNYATATRNRLGELAEFKPPARDGRLILFHGEPGTGKSHAITALAAEWRDWADLMIISDPERLMTDPNYLLNLIRTSEGDTRHMRAQDWGRWQILVLEDAGEFLTPTAKTETGQALSRLLNITDGIVGRASRSLLLITTNEHISTLHPAVSRPGRCLAEIEFTALEEDEITAWCDHHGVASPDQPSLTVAELYATTRGKRIKSAKQKKIGFAA